MCVWGGGGGGGGGGVSLKACMCKVGARIKRKGGGAFSGETNFVGFTNFSGRQTLWRSI